MQEDAIIAAHHEASHALAGYLLGGRVGRIKIDGQQHKDTSISWDGDAAIDTGGLAGENIAVIALAGPLGEIKIRGHLEAMSLLNQPIDFGSSSAFLQVINNVVDGKKTEPMSVRPTLVLGLQRHSFRVHLGNFIDDFMKARNAAQSLESAFLRAAEIVNSAKNWGVISQLARAITDTTEQTVLRKEVSEQRVQALLSASISEGLNGSGLKS